MPIRISPVYEEAGAVARFEHESGDGWTVAGTVSRGPQGLVISHLEIWPGRPGDPPSASVTSKLLSSVRVGAIIEAVRVWEARRKLQALVADTTYDPEDEVIRRSLEAILGDGTVGISGSSVTIAPADQVLSENAPEKPQPGRAPLPDELLVAVAEGYIVESGPGKPRGAVKRLAQRLGRPEATVSRWVARARKEGWLGPGAPGREVGEPGPKLMAARLEELKRRNPGLISHVQVDTNDGTVTDVSAPPGE